MREITDRVTVLRDGALVGTVVTAETSETQFVEMIIGRRLAALGEVEHADLTRRSASASRVDGPDRRERPRRLVRRCTRARSSALTGLIGSGFEEVPHLLYGARQAAAGPLDASRGVPIDLDAARAAPARSRPGSR